MRSAWLAAITFAVATVPLASHALEASDTMKSWAAASAGEKSSVVERLLKADGREGVASDVVKCVDAAAGISGHADLSVKTVIEACAKQAGEPV